MPQIQVPRPDRAIRRSLALLVIAGGACRPAGDRATSPSGGTGGASAGPGVGVSSSAVPSASVASGDRQRSARAQTAPSRPAASCRPRRSRPPSGHAVIEAVPYGDTECRWRVQPLPAFPGAADTWLDVQFFVNDAAHAGTSRPSRLRRASSSVDGLGDRAFRTNSFHHLWVKHGNDAFVVRSRLACPQRHLRRKPPRGRSARGAPGARRPGAAVNGREPGRRHRAGRCDPDRRGLWGWWHGDGLESGVAVRWARRRSCRRALLRPPARPPRLHRPHRARRHRVIAVSDACALTTPERARRCRRVPLPGRPRRHGRDRLDDGLCLGPVRGRRGIAVQRQHPGPR